jgi:hypothetical protein
MKHTIYLSRETNNFRKFLGHDLGEYMLFPETKLHPAEFVQCIPDILTWNTSAKIATHSECLINFIGEMISKHLAQPSDFEIIILNDDGTRRTCTYDDEGYLKNWAYGFFSSYGSC